MRVLYNRVVVAGGIPKIIAYKSSEGRPLDLRMPVLGVQFFTSNDDLGLFGIDLKSH